MAWVVYSLFKKSQLDGSSTGTPINLSSDTLRVMLTTSSYSPTVASDQYRTTPAAFEVSGTNYTSRGFALASKTFTLATGTVTFDAADIVVAQSGSGFSNARIAVLFKDSGTDSTSPLIAYADLGANVGNVGGALTLSIASNNIFTLA